MPWQKSDAPTEGVDWESRMDVRYICCVAGRLASAVATRAIWVYVQFNFRYCFLYCTVGEMCVENVYFAKYTD